MVTLTEDEPPELVLICPAVLSGAKAQAMGSNANARLRARLIGMIAL
jgi:hypothetical protein